MQSQVKSSAPVFAPDATDEMHDAVHSSDVQTNEQDLADYLVQTPEFFDRYGHILAGVRLSDPNSGRAVSLQERQLEVLRTREKQLQSNLDHLVQLARSNDQIVDRLAQFSRALLSVRQAEQMPQCVVSSLKTIFDVPQVALRLWDVSDAVDPQFTDGADVDTRRMTAALREPYCGLKGDIAQVRWLSDGGVSARSVALMPVCDEGWADGRRFGLIVMGSTDADRFQTGMGTEFLQRISQSAGAAMLRLVRDDIR